MRWLDVAGAPGSGKSTLCDDLWPPRCIEWDGRPHPEEWRPFLDCVDRLLKRIAGHPSHGACVSMIERSFRKMATVARMDDPRVYVQTGFAQRGLGIGWRLRDPEEIADYYETMPVSLGVVFLHADVSEVQRRNVERGKDRSFMVPLMETPRRIAVDVLRRRGVPVTDIDTSQSVESCREMLIRAA